MKYSLTLTTLLFVLVTGRQAMSPRKEPDQDDILTVKTPKLDKFPVVPGGAPRVNNPLGIGPALLPSRKSVRRRFNNQDANVTISSKKAHKPTKPKKPKMSTSTSVVNGHNLHAQQDSSDLTTTPPDSNSNTDPSASTLATPDASSTTGNSLFANTSLAAAGGAGGTGISTFNVFETQSSVACQWSKSLSNLNPNSYSSGSPVFAAAVSDMSKAVWKSAPCDAPPQDAKWCNGHGGAVPNAPANIMAPSCSGEFPENGGPCGSCYHVLCIGSQDGETSGSCNPKGIIVRVVDACPSGAAGNYCKTTKYGGSVVDGACASSTNQFDIAHQAKLALSTFQGNLKISFSKVTCPAGV